MFQSALAQAEELWDAAASVGPRTRPLPLYYALSQAGRAICAAWKANEWQPKSHGLNASEPSKAQPLRFPIAIADDTVGAFRMVAAATDSALFEGQTTIADLWASLPSFPTETAVIGEALQPLRLMPQMTAGASDWMEQMIEATAPKRGRLTSFGPRSPEEELVDYPSTQGYVVEERLEYEGIPSVTLVLSFPDSNGKPQPLSGIGDLFNSKGGPSSGFAVRPRIGMGSGPPPSQLLSLWALLYGFSRLARYHPDVWIRLLDPDKSPTAVPLELGLELALTRVPELVGPALSGIPWIARAARERQANRDE